MRHKRHSKTPLASSNGVLQAFGNVEISGNTVIGGAALLLLTQEEPLIKMADGATPIVKDNKLGENVKTSVIWVRADGVDTNLIDALPRQVDISWRERGRC